MAEYNENAKEHLIIGRSKEETEYITDSIKWIFGLGRFFSALFLCYIWIFEALFPSFQPTYYLSIFLIISLIVSIPCSKNSQTLKFQFFIAMLIYSINISMAIFVQGGIFDPSTQMLYTLLLIVTSFLISPNLAFLFAGLIILEYYSIIFMQYFHIIAFPRYSSTPVPKKLLIDVACSFAIYMGFIAIVSNKLASSLRKQNRILLDSMEKLHILSKLDPLTEIYNRRYLEEKFDEELSKCKLLAAPFSAILIDIDHLDEINLKFGYIVGDRALKQTAELLKKTLRTNDLLFRYGGDEFIILLPEVNSEDAEKIGMRLKNNIEQENIFHHNSTSMPLTACFGLVSASMLANLAMKDFVNHANTALVEAKSQGPATLFKISF